MNFLQDNNGNDSLMRLMCVIALIIAGTIAIIGLLKNQNTDVMVALFLSAAFGGKVAQKKIEDD